MRTLSLALILLPACAVAPPEPAPVEHGVVNTDKCGSSPHLNYGGGAVIPHVEVTTIFWGTNVWYTNDINAWFPVILDSPYLDWLSEYDSLNYPEIGRGSLAGTYTDSTAPIMDTVDDSLIQARLRALLDVGALPRQNGNRLFVVYFPRTVSTVTSGTAASCKEMCGYHGSFSYQNQLYPYAVIPNQACPDGSGGTQPCVDSAYTDDAEVATFIASSHEVIESITDPDGQAGWRDNNTGCEIGDICHSGVDWSIVNGVFVEQGWSDSRDACLGTNPNDFSLLISPVAQSASNGQTVRYHVVSADTGTRLILTLSTPNVPNFLKVWFDSPVITSGDDTWLNVAPKITSPFPMPVPFMVQGNSIYGSHDIPALVTIVP